MKRISIPAIMLCGLCLSITACTEKDAPQQGGSTILQPLTTAKKIEKKVNVLEVQKSIQEYFAANGRYPADLNEVAAFNGITLESDGYMYDPATGILTQRP
jgi:hypothetical protein